MRKPHILGETQRGLSFFALIALAAFMFLTVPRARSADGLDTAGIPAAAKGVFFVDAMPESPFGVALREILLRNVPPAPAQVADMGFAPSRDIRGVVIAVLPPEAAAAAPRGIVLLRGNFDFQTILAAAEKKSVRPVEIGGRKFVDAGFLGSVSNFTGKNQNAKFLLGAATPKILVLADAPGASESIAAFDSSEKAWRAPPAFEKLRSSGIPLLLGCVERGLFPQMDVPADTKGQDVRPPDAIRFILSEKSGVLRLHIEADFPSPEDTRRAGAQVKTLFDLWVLNFTRKQESDTAAPPPSDTKAGAGSNAGAGALSEADLQRERVLRLHEAARILPAGGTLHISVEYPAADATKLLRELASPRDKSAP